MDDKYKQAIENENNIYKEMKKTLLIPKECSTGMQGLDRALDWLCIGSETILDFGCGNGTMLFLCAHRGVKKLYGIDLAEEGINCAKLRKKMMDKGEYYFKVGSLELLQRIENNKIDGIVLSNILDNMYPGDVTLLLAECARILKGHGKVMVKLNPFITEKQIMEWKMKKIGKDVYDDGFILWNRSTVEWVRELETKFRIVDVYEFNISESEQINRIILMEK